MRLTLPSPTTTWTLEAVLAHLARQPAVDGILLLGSLTAGTLHASSDYDVAIVLHNAPALLYVGITTIDHRLTDLLFVAPAALERIATLATAVALHDPLTPIIRWLQHGRIVVDQSGLLRAAQQHVASGDWIDTYPDRDLFGTWFATNYNLAQTRRLLRAPDPLYQHAAEIRMATHAPMDVWYCYFTLRRIVDTGEKDALRYLVAHDPAFLHQYQQFIRARDPRTKLGRYEHTAALALEPWGGVWTAATTAMNEVDTLERWAALFAPPR